MKSRAVVPTGKQKRKQRKQTVGGGKQKQKKKSEAMTSGLLIGSYWRDKLHLSNMFF